MCKFIHVYVYVHTHTPGLKEKYISVLAFLINLFYSPFREGAMDYSAITLLYKETRRMSMQ